MFFVGYFLFIKIIKFSCVYNKQIANLKYLTFYNETLKISLKNVIYLTFN